MKWPSCCDAATGLPPSPAGGRQGWGLFIRSCASCPPASRVSARRPSYFLLRRQKKVAQEKATPPSATRAAHAARAPCAARPTGEGRETRPAGSDSASFLIPVVLCCSAQPEGRGQDRVLAFGIVRGADKAARAGASSCSLSLWERAGVRAPSRDAEGEPTMTPTPLAAPRSAASGG